MKNLFKQLLLETPQIRNAIYNILYRFDTLVGRSSKVFILCYHGIGNDSWRYSIPFALFKKQMAFLKKSGYTFIPLSELEEMIVNGLKLPAKSVVLTFDDGYKELLHTSEFLKSEKIYPTLFLLSDTTHPNRQELANERAFLNSTDILTLKKYGWEFGSHSATHSNLAELSKKELHREIVESKNFLEKHTKSTISAFAYPRGKYNANVLAATKKAGYTLGLSMEDGQIDNHTNRLLLPRIGIDKTHTMEQFPQLFSPSVIGFRKIVKQSFLGRYL